MSIVTSVFVLMKDSGSEGHYLLSVHCTKEGAKKARDVEAKDIMNIFPTLSLDRARAEFWIDEQELLP